MTNDLIRRQDALDEAFVLEYAFSHHEAVKLYYEYLKGALEMVPAVDAVEVVRCKDCLRRYSVMCPMRFFDYEDGEYADYTKHNYFCSSGERKTNDD